MNCLSLKKRRKKRGATQEKKRSGNVSRVHMLFFFFIIIFKCSTRLCSVFDLLKALFWRARLIKGGWRQLCPHTVLFIQCCRTSGSTATLPERDFRLVYCVCYGRLLYATTVSIQNQKRFFAKSRSQQRGNFFFSSVKRRFNGSSSKQCDDGEKNIFLFYDEKGIPPHLGSVICNLRPGRSKVTACLLACPLPPWWIEEASLWSLEVVEDEEGLTTPPDPASATTPPRTCGDH